MRSTRRHLLGGGLAAVLPGLPAAASAQAAGTDTRPVLRIGVADLPPTLEPAKELSNVGTRITYSVFDTLIRRDFLSSPDGGGARLVPHLATAWRREGDRDLLVTLRPGVRFHNGDTLAAEDVVFTFGRMMGDQPLLVEATSYFPTLESVTAAGPLAVRFRTRVPDILLEQRLASWCSWIVNKRAYEELGLQGFGQAPVGTGPYRLRSLRRDQAIVLDAFDDYWMGRPTARAVEFRGIPQVAGRTAAADAGNAFAVREMTHSANNHATRITCSTRGKKITFSPPASKASSGFGGSAASDRFSLSSALLISFARSFGL